MSISAAELKVHRSRSITDDPATNGGAIHHTELVSGVKNNIFQDVTEAERTAGLTRYRKIFVRVANDDDLTLYNAKFHLRSNTPGQDRISFFKGTMTDVQNAIGMGECRACALKNNIVAGANSAVLTAETTASTLAWYGGIDCGIYITDGTNEEYHPGAGLSAGSGTDVNVNLDIGDQFLNNFAAGSTFVSQYLLIGNVAAAFSGWSETSSAGTYDESGVPPLLDNIGTTQDVWTITITNGATGAFSCSGAYWGAQSAGNKSSDYAPNHPFWGKPMFTLRASGWAGTWATGDRIVFTTSPAAVPIWLKEVVPAGAASYAGNTVDFRLVGESA